MERRPLVADGRGRRAAGRAHDRCAGHRVRRDRLAAAYLGGFSFVQLADAARVRSSSPVAWPRRRAVPNRSRAMVPGSSDLLSGLSPRLAAAPADPRAPRSRGGVADADRVDGGPSHQEPGRHEHREMERIGAGPPGRIGHAPDPFPPAGSVSGWISLADLPGRSTSRPGTSDGERRVEGRRDDDEQDRADERRADPADGVVDRRPEAGIPHRDGAHQRGRQRRDQQGDPDAEDQRAEHDVDERRHPAGPRSPDRRGRARHGGESAGMRASQAGPTAISSGPTVMNSRGPNRADQLPERRRERGQQDRGRNARPLPPPSGV